MRRIGVTVALAAGVALDIAACSSSSTPEPGAGGAPPAYPGADCPLGAATGDLPCDVAAVLKASCQPCHQMPPLNGAHFPLLTYEDTQQPFGLPPDDGGLQERRWQRMSQVTTPGFLPQMPSQVAAACDGSLCKLTDAERATLDAWFSACAPPKPEGQGCDVDGSVTDAGTDGG